MKTDIRMTDCTKCCKNFIWKETCDRCGKETERSEITIGFTGGKKLNTDEADFCLECLRYFTDNNISLEEATKQYKK